MPLAKVTIDGLLITTKGAVLPKALKSFSVFSEAGSKSNNMLFQSFNCTQDQ